MKLLMILWQHWNLVPIDLLQVKRLKNLYTALYANETILYFNEDSGNGVFNCNGIAILDLDNGFDEDAIILIKLLAWDIKLGKRKELEEYKWRILKNLSEELMVTVWHPKR